MRTEHNPALAYPVEHREGKRCRCNIRLGENTYRCARGMHIDGIHDANARHPADGGLVRW